MKLGGLLLMARYITKSKKINGKFIYFGRAEKSVSIRLPFKVYDIIMSHHGKNFSDKLISLVLEYHELSDSDFAGKM